MNTIARNYAVFFLVPFLLGLICILRSYEIGRYFLPIDGWNPSREIFNGAVWIAIGGVISLLSGYGLIRIILKYVN